MFEEYINKLGKLGAQEQKDLYDLAFKLHAEERYSDAEPLFKELLISNPFEGHYWKGYAAALIGQMKYEAALQAWATLALLEPNNPAPYFHSAECYYFLLNMQEALKALSQAEEYGFYPEQIKRLKGAIHDSKASLSY